MKNFYGSLEDPANVFTDHYQPRKEESKCCTCSTPTLITRFFLRTTIPLLFGLSCGMLTEWAERQQGMHYNYNMIELSDFSACAVTLMSAYFMDFLFNCCWPTKPYKNQNSDLFQERSNRMSLKTYSYDSTDDQFSFV